MSHKPPKHVPGVVERDGVEKRRQKLRERKDRDPASRDPRRDRNPTDTSTLAAPPPRLPHSRR